MPSETLRQLLRLAREPGEPAPLIGLLTGRFPPFRQRWLEGKAAEGARGALRAEGEGLLGEIEREARRAGLAALAEVAGMARKGLRQTDGAGALEAALDLLSAYTQAVRLEREGGFETADTLLEAITRNYEFLRARGVAGSTAEGEGRFRGLSVLVADDEPLIRSLLTDLLAGKGHEVEAVDRGDAALERIDHGLFDVIFTDIKMPGANGIEVLKHARFISPETEVVILTGYATVENAASAVHYGAYDYLTKPFQHSGELDGLIRRLEESVRLKRENRRLVVELRLRNEELKQYIASLEEALRTIDEKQQALVRVDRMATLGVLAAGVAHEINNPTTYISGNLQTFRRFWEIVKPLLEGLDPEVRAGVSKLDLVLREMPRLVEDMLLGTERISRIVSGLRSFVHPHHATETRAPLPPHQPIEEALALLGGQLREVEIERAYQPDPPRLSLAAQQMTQVFVNLILNAVQAMEGRKSKRLRLWTGTEANAFLIRVEDTGGGMSPEVCKRIFDPFYTTKPVGKGTGLGLSIVQGILREHEGSIEVKSTPGTGTTFQIRLPLFKTRQTLQEEEEKKKPLILIVDDEEGVLDLVYKVLKKSGLYQIITASSGFQAMVSITESRPDIVLLDVRIPDINGFEIISSIRKNPLTEGIRIIAMTGVLSESVRHRLEYLGVNAILGKPFAAETLRAEVRRQTEWLTGAGKR